MILPLLLAPLLPGTGQLAVEEGALLPGSNHVDVSGDWAVVSQLSFFTGAVTIFERQGQTWVLDSTPTTSGRGASISDRRIVYGRRSACYAPALELTGGVWQTYPQIDWTYGDNHDQFGYATAMHDKRVAVSASDWGLGLGGVWIYDDTPAGWVVVDWFDTWPYANQWGLGLTLDLSERWVVSPTQNKVLVHDLQTSQGTLIDPGAAGARSVAVDGDTLVIGKPDEPDDGGVVRGALFLFEFDGAEWVRGPELRATDGLAGDRFGVSVALDGDVLLVGAEGVAQPAGLGDGAAYVFRRVANTWVELGRFARTTPGTAPMGIAVALDGEVAAVSSLGATYAFRLDTSLPPTPYCTAGTTASGCRATLGASGTPSASQASGFLVTVSAAEGQKDGTIYFGTNGTQASPWGNGTSLQCVVPPVVRTGALPGSGTAGSCDGSFLLDFNAWMSTHPLKAPAAGADVAMQCWFRDPQNSSNQSTSLSAGLLFTVCP